MAAPSTRSFPPWLKKQLPLQADPHTQRVLTHFELNTVCRSAECPNLGECWARRSAAFLILGARCTRACRFCAVTSGQPQPLEELADEPARIAQGCQQLGLKHVVITSVTRDDLPDEGSGHFAAVIRAVRAACGPELSVEVLVPDFHARAECVSRVLEAQPAVFNHNLETVRRLYPQVRPQADYRRSLDTLKIAKTLPAAVATKSGLMVGLGEQPAEVCEALEDLRAVGCEVVTIGQYLQPSRTHLAVQEFVPPEVFKAYESRALSLGFSAVAAGPFVRSSYQAEQVWARARKSE